MELTIYSSYEKKNKNLIPIWEEIKDDALVLYTNGYLETIRGHIRFFNIRQDGTYEWTAGSSDDVTDLVECWFKKIK